MTLTPPAAPGSDSGSEHPSRLSIGVLIVTPVVVFIVLTVVTMMGIGFLSLMSAMGHGQLTDEEARPYWIAGGLITLAATVITSRFLERRVLGRPAERTPSVRRLAWKARLTSAGLALAIVILGPMALREASFRGNASAARGADGPARFGAISKLGGRQTPRAYETLHGIAADTRDDPHARAEALVAMSFYSEAAPAIIAFAGDPDPVVRAGVGRALLMFAGDPQAWATIEKLSRDETLLVREQMAEAVAGSTRGPLPEEKRAALLRDITKSDSPGAALSAARGLGAAGYDTAWQTLMEEGHLDGTRIDAIRVLGTVKDPRALPMLRSIVLGTAGPRFLAPDWEQRYRDVAAEAIYGIMSAEPDGEEWVAYANEYPALDDLRQLVRAQKTYAEVTRFFDARLSCLELPSSCVAWPDPDESLLRPLIATGLPRRGYTRRLIPGPPVSPDQIASAKASRSSVTTFAVVATPDVPGVTGIRAFCGDDTGAICYTRDGRAPDARNGRCPGTPADVPGSPSSPRVCLVSR